MASLIAALPDRSATSAGALRVYYTGTLEGSSTDGNIINVRQVDYLKEKNWGVYYSEGYGWKEYEGQPWEYDLWVNGTRVTTANCDDIERLTNWNQGRMSYDEITNTLTLDSVYIGSTSTNAIRDSIPGLTIKLNGASTLNISKGEGLRTYFDATITGTGSLTMNVGGANNGIYIYNGTLTVTGGALEYTYTVATGLVTIACPTYVRGDVNMDGAVNSADVTALTSILLGEQAETELSDVNGDGMVSIADISELIGLLIVQ
ncbi:MAG: dockerin type I repeat-containing protein [Prevotella sp.]|nr:dockerin type I repeat-containing protein [Prevotella sp.]